MDTIIQVEGLRKVYGETIAVDGISFHVQEGEIFGMVGPNGAGKTTTIECLEGLRKPDQGKIRVLDMNPARDGKALRKQVGMQLQQSNLPDRMKVWEALDLYASFYPQSTAWQELMAQLGLQEKRNAPFSKLSGGQKQRLFIALALLPQPQLVFLDELTTGWTRKPAISFGIWCVRCRPGGRRLFSPPISWKRQSGCVIASPSLITEKLWRWIHQPT